VEFSDEDMLEVSVNSDGQVYIGDRHIEWEHLSRELKKLKEKRRIDAVALRGSKDVRYEMIMKAVDAIKDAEIANMGLVALKE
jgi:biopolymer transport protein ExbD